MTTVILLVCLLLTAYAVLARRRHLRLRAACTTAFERCYATTSPRPHFEMSYSYGEPAFLVRFEGKDAAAAADANSAFLREIGELCKDRGRKRQFKAERSVFFRYPADPDEAKIVHCCEAMSAHVGTAIAYSGDTRTYGLRTSKAGTPPLAIAHCPWCGSALPPRS